MGLEGFEAYLIRKGLSQSTITHTIGKVKYVLTHYPELTSDAISHFIVSKRKDLTNNSLNVYLKALKHYGVYTSCSHLVELQLLPDNDTVRATFSIEELRRFLAVKEGESNGRKHLWSLFFKLVALGGFRCGEIAGLRVGDCDFANETVSIKGKTGIRTVPMPKSLVSELATECNKHDDYLYPKVGATHWGDEFHRRLRLLGIKRTGLVPHSLRRSYITHMLRTPGVNLFDVKNLVGHKQTATTELYYSLDAERLKVSAGQHPLIVENSDGMDKVNYIVSLIRNLSPDYQPNVEKVSGGHEIRVLIRGSPPTKGNPTATAKH